MKPGAIQIKRRIYPTCAIASSDVFDGIEMFYNPIRRYGSAGGWSPVEFERHYAQNDPSSRRPLTMGPVRAMLHGLPRSKQRSNPNPKTPEIDRS